MANRTSTFQLLKPGCVSLGQKALQFSANKASAQEVIVCLDSVQAVVASVSSPKHGLDEKIAEYVFYPLTHIFRDHQKLPSRASEIALQCLNILLQSGWRRGVPPDLAAQLLILLTVLAGGDLSRQNTKTISEEVQVEALNCLASLFAATEHSDAGKKALTNTANIPALGHAITVILDLAVTSRSRTVQSSALDTLCALLEALPDRDVTASFFPGIVSALTKILTPDVSTKRPFKALSRALDSLCTVLNAVVADEHVAKLLEDESAAVSEKSIKASPLNASWLKATAAQIKLALANVVRQRAHERVEVRQALLKLCMTIMERCRRSLAESTALILETMITMAQAKDLSEAEDDIKLLITQDFAIAELIRDSLYNWLISLPRVMQSNDDNSKQKSIGQVSASFRLLADTGIDMSIIETVLTENLRDTVVNAIHVPSSFGNKSKERGKEAKSTESQLISVHQSASEFEFAPVLVGHKSGRETLVELQSLIKQLSTSESSQLLARNMLDLARYNQDKSRVASFWLSLNIVKSSTDALMLEDIMALDDTPSARIDVSEEIYSFSLSQLEDQDVSSEGDWRMQALALEGLAFRAAQLKHDFRTELVEALYPVLHLMGSPSQQLREHSMTCLNIMAKECGYASAKDLVVENVDYLVNAVGMKLSVFDISPQLPQVLQMMIKLCGPVLLPYLDDLVDNIFEALECFHGYPKLVEILFSVLRSMVEEGVKAPQLMIAAKEEAFHLKSSSAPLAVEKLALMLKEARSNTLKRSTAAAAAAIDEGNEDLPSVTPRQPWKDLNSRPPFPADPSDTDPEEDLDEAPRNSDTKPAAVSRTYTLLHRITALTQHHLPSSSPSIRLSLLALLASAIPYLSTHDDTFLPLINTLWPVLLPRLADKEAFVVAGVLDVMGLMCEGAGSFMTGRIMDAWSEVRRIWLGVESVVARTERETPSAAGMGKSRRLITEAAPTKPTVLAQRPSSDAMAPSLRLSLAELASVTTSSPTALQEDAALTARSSTPISASQTSYIPTPTLYLQQSLRRFLLRIISNLAAVHNSRLPFRVSEEIAGSMLRRELLAGEEEVRRVLEAWDEDAVWLILLRARGEAEKISWERRRAGLTRAAGGGEGTSAWVAVV